MDPDEGDHDAATLMAQASVLAWDAERERLIGLAHRMLGSLA